MKGRLNLVPAFRDSIQRALRRKMYLWKAASFDVLLEGENRERFISWLTCI